MKMRICKPRGYAMVEILAIAAILGILAFLVVPRLTASSDAAKEKLNSHHKAVINAAVERFYVETGKWPTDDLSDIARDANFFPDGIPANPLDGSQYKLEPGTHRAK